jgi:glucose-6-phosphate-specific signal transduction histidine kinase
MQVCVRWFGKGEAQQPGQVAGWSWLSFVLWVTAMHLSEEQQAAVHIVPSGHYMVLQLFVADRVLVVLVPPPTALCSAGPARCWT